MPPPTLHMFDQALRCAGRRQTNRYGQVTIAIVAQRLPPLYACHCLNCQRWSGSAFGLHMLSAASAVQVAGETAIFEHEHQGHTSTQHACGLCHTRLFNETTAAPGMRVVRAGILECVTRRTANCEGSVARRADGVRP
ncbi:GFA family protein [Pseudomonas sp. NPDC089422]|uniref:GFA family protein n=1 Tax=Pseudomonas sp. NPDC089422 TaxID=3364466 RepID=UPI00381CC907